MSEIKINLTPPARLHLVSLLDVQEGRAGDLRIWNDIAEKVEVPQGERGKFLERELHDGTAILSDAANDEANAVEFSLGKEEARKLTELLKSWPHFKRSALKGWVDPLLKQLEQ